MSTMNRTQLRIKEIEYVKPRKTKSNNTILKQFAHTIQCNPNVNHTSAVDVKTLCKQGRLKEALHILHNMGIILQSSAYVCLLQGCIRKKSLSDGKRVHCHMEERGFTGDILSHNTLLNMYVKCGSLVDARRVFDRMTKRDVCSWTVMIAGYARHGPAEEALTLFRQMQRTGFQPDPFAFSGVLSACSKLTSLEHGVEIHQEIIRRGFESDLSVANALVDMYGKCGEMEKARELFDKMHQRDIIFRPTILQESLSKKNRSPRPNLFYRCGRSLIMITPYCCGKAKELPIPFGQLAVTIEKNYRLMDAVCDCVS